MFFHYADDLTDNKKQLEILCKKYNLTEEKLKNTIKTTKFDVQKDDGYLLVLDDRVYSDFPTSWGDEGIRIHVPSKGLPIEYIKQIVPLSKDGKKFLQNP